MLSPSRLSVVVPLVALAGAALVGCSSTGSSKASISAPATTEAPAPTAAPPGEAPSTAASMTIASFKYDPTPLTVAPGTTIPVRNTDGPEHTVTSDVTGLFLADDIAHGNTVTFKAPSKTGTYTFHCQYHASMHGTLIVK